MIVTLLSQFAFESSQVSQGRRTGLVMVVLLLFFYILIDTMVVVVKKKFCQHKDVKETSEYGTSAQVQVSAISVSPVTSLNFEAQVAQRLKTMLEGKDDMDQDVVKLINTFCQQYSQF
jgi:hypothetical protein